MLQEITFTNINNSNEVLTAKVDYELHSAETTDETSTIALNMTFENLDGEINVVYEVDSEDETITLTRDDNETYFHRNFKNINSQILSFGEFLNCFKSDEFDGMIDGLLEEVTAEI